MTEIQPGLVQNRIRQQITFIQTANAEPASQFSPIYTRKDNNYNKINSFNQHERTQLELAKIASNNVFERRAKSPDLSCHSEDYNASGSDVFTDDPDGKLSKRNSANRRLLDRSVSFAKAFLQQKNQQKKQLELMANMLQEHKKQLKALKKEKAKNKKVYSDNSSGGDYTTESSESNSSEETSSTNSSDESAASSSESAIEYSSSSSTDGNSISSDYNVTDEERGRRAKNRYVKNRLPTGNPVPGVSGNRIVRGKNNSVCSGGRLLVTRVNSISNNSYQSNNTNNSSRHNNLRRSSSTANNIHKYRGTQQSHDYAIPNHTSNHNQHQRSSRSHSRKNLSSNYIICTNTSDKHINKYHSYGWCDKHQIEYEMPKRQEKKNVNRRESFTGKYDKFTNYQKREKTNPYQEHHHHQAKMEESFHSGRMREKSSRNNNHSNSRINSRNSSPNKSERGSPIRYESNRLYVLKKNSLDRQNSNNSTTYSRPRSTRNSNLNSPERTASIRSNFNAIPDYLINSNSNSVTRDRIISFDDEAQIIGKHRRSPKRSPQRQSSLLVNNNNNHHHQRNNSIGPINNNNHRARTTVKRSSSTFVTRTKDPSISSPNRGEQLTSQIEKLKHKKSMMRSNSMNKLGYNSLAYDTTAVPSNVNSRLDELRQNLKNCKIPGYTDEDEYNENENLDTERDVSKLDTLMTDSRINQTNQNLNSQTLNNNSDDSDNQNDDDLHTVITNPATAIEFTGF